MSKRIPQKMLSMALLLAILALVAYSMDAAFWISGHLLPNRSANEDLVAIHLEQYNSPKSQPVQLGYIKNPENAYIRLKFRFRATSTDGYPNLFQTAPVNSGMRMEISGTTAAIVVRDLVASGGLRGMTLSTTIKTGKWYTLEVEVLNRSFVRATLDGRPVASFVGESLSIETTDLIVGGGFDSSRYFRGDIQNISVTKGNLHSLPQQRLLIVYMLLAILISAFCISFWWALGENSGVQKLAGKLIILSLPLIFILGYFEYRLSVLNTNYYAKRIALEKQLSEIEVLVEGSSNTFYGVAPAAFSQKGFNLAFPGNGMFFDARFVEKYAEKMPRLKTVVLTVNYFTMGTDYATFTQSWRQYFLRQYFGISTIQSSGRMFDYGFWLEPRNFSRFALYGNEAKTYMDSGYLAPVDIIATSSGWFDGGDVPGNPANNFGVDGATSHNASTDERNYDKNLQDWEEIVTVLQQKNIKVAIVLLPTDATYHNNLDKIKVEVMNRKLTEFANRHHIRFVNYTGDSRFTLNDFTWEMPDHMNAQGAMKFSKILDEEVIKPQW